MTESAKHDPDAAVTDFIRERIQEDLASGAVEQVVTRFPPEPNGYLHIGHAKAITLVFSVAAEFGGRCNLRMDDTNPEKEAQEFVDAIQEDVRWLGFQWDGMFFASDYFGQLYAWAEQLVEKGLAYVDDQSAEECAARRPLFEGRVSTIDSTAGLQDVHVDEAIRGLMCEQ
mgnify:CR=1 FL=1